jgi:hypothetical protein
MMKRLVLSAAAAAFVLGGAAAEAAGDVTLLLRSGERISGELADYDYSTLLLREGYDSRRSVRWSDIVLIDFGGDARDLPQAEVDAARGRDHLMVLRGGQVLKGRLVDFVSEGTADAAVVFDAMALGRQQVSLDRVERLYVGRFTPEATASAGVDAASGGQTGASVERNAFGSGYTVRVPGNTEWMPTGILVRKGQRLGLRSDGTVFLVSDRQDESRPAGAVTPRYATGAPLPDVLAGALIGRIGERGTPFGIGNQDSIYAPESGELFLGINDDAVGDNQGAYTVRLTVSGSRVR